MAKIEDSKVMVGLEVGTHKIVVVVGEVLPDGVINVYGSGVSASKGVVNGNIVDLNAASLSIQRAIEEAESISNQDICAVTLAITGENIKSENKRGSIPLPMGVVREEDLDNALKNASHFKLQDGQELLHCLQQEYKVDFLPAIKNPIGLEGTRLEAQAHMITCSSPLRRNLENAVELCKLKVQDVIFSGLASSASVLTENEKELGVCLIDIGGGTTDILVYTDGALRSSASIPIGGENITSYIASQVLTSLQDAENIKIHYGSAISPPKHFPEKKIEVAGLGGRNSRTISKALLSEYTASCYRKLFAIIQDELLKLRDKLAQNGIKQDLIAGFVLTGGGSQIEDIVECAQSIFEAPVRLGEPLNITGLTDYVSKPQYATVLGLLQYSHHRMATSDGGTGRFSSAPPNKMFQYIKKGIDYVRSKI